MMQDTPPSGPPGPTLFVTGLPVDCTNDFCKSIFGQYGIVKDARMLPVAPGKTAAAAVVEMNTADDAKWIVEHVNGNVPQSLTTPVTVSFKFKGKGFGKGFDKGGLGGALGALAGLAPALDMAGGKGKGAEGGGNPAAAALLQALVPLVAAVAGGGKGAWYPPKPPPGMQICRYFEAGVPCPRNGCHFWHGDGDGKDTADAKEAVAGPEAVPGAMPGATAGALPGIPGAVPAAFPGAVLGAGFGLPMGNGMAGGYW
ncbi:unnamed protein product [Symbiodinium necroappetens]|uniref:C3H1-type domain-containing protein n=1 Tax=Symbiodinium necroappetens TaxID=1628268 RepID=A0A812JPL7_9DINO|nr:unnamed protein product [Symbiodinium necroappetens]|eukprot:CAMPEP_0181464126 /NCGR_PEP_ID=MMETSP1110-20121109/35268_1 /TAXON_ID=174948 /ORGANISM="Symbiodinium sp., Strain CCMP421" /LENGTH=255 /DNA_ID=CAMNT_0023588843 /DNA_START=17 /DNA_END=784 /DNA_ORIENTATION=-